VPFQLNIIFSIGIDIFFTFLRRNVAQKLLTFNKVDLKLSLTGRYGFEGIVKKLKTKCKIKYPVKKFVQSPTTPPV
jgi:hypothetical protein